jgi:hypothetical protein
MLTAPPMPEAACRNQLPIFDLTIPERPGKLPAEVAQARRIAMDICNNDCTELLTCRRWLDGLEPTQKPLGVVAGIVIDRRRAREVA